MIRLPTIWNVLIIKNYFPLYRELIAFKATLKREQRLGIYLRYLWNARDHVSEDVKYMVES